MELLGDMGHVEACFHPIREVLISAQDWYMVAPNVPRERKSFWPHLMDLLGGVGQMEAYFGPFGDSVYLDARLVHGLRRKCNRLIYHFGTPDGTPR
jgi:hypothetical protein